MDAKHPAPGLRGTLEGTCVVCLKPTDTGMAIRGEPEAAIAALLVMGAPEDQATATVTAYCERELGSPPGTVPDGEITLTFRLCARCARKLPGARVALIYAGAEIPVYAQRR